MFCSKCGNQLSEGARFCELCGQSVQEESMSKSNFSMNKNKYSMSLIDKILIITGVIITIIGTYQLANMDSKYHGTGDYLIREAYNRALSETRKEYFFMILIGVIIIISGIIVGIIIKNKKS